MIDIIIGGLVVYIIYIVVLFLLEQPGRNLVLVGVVNDRFQDGKLIWKKITEPEGFGAGFARDPYIVIDKNDPFTLGDIETISWIEQNNNIGTPQGTLVHNIVTKEAQAMFQQNIIDLRQLGSISKQIKEENVDIQSLIRKYN